MKYLVIIIVFLTIGCKKLPGEGGNSRLTGNLQVETRLVLTNPNTIQDTLVGADEDVFLIYGDHISPDDKVVTDYNGDFEFRNLRPGEYTLYVYSKDTLGNGTIQKNKMPIIRQISIEGKKKTIDLETIFIYDNN